MNANNYFSFARIMMVLKRDWVENRKTHLYQFLAFYGGCLILILSNLGRYSGETQTWDAPDSCFAGFSAAVWGGVTLMTLIGGVLSASLIMDCMGSKEKRTAYLMLPATMTEKFVARTLLITAGYALTVGAAVLLAEGTRYLLLPLFDLPDAFHRSLLSVGRIRMNGPENMADVLGGLNGVLFGVAHYSLFILGGNYWYKHAFLKTLSALVVVSLAGLLLIGQAILWVGEANFERLGEWVEANVSWICSVPLEGVLGVMATLQTLFILFLWWLSYRLFIRAQVVKPKFRLL